MHKNTLDKQKKKCLHPDFDFITISKDGQGKKGLAFCVEPDLSENRQLVTFNFCFKGHFEMHFYISCKQSFNQSDLQVSYFICLDFYVV